MPAPSTQPERINIVGTTGAGKTILAGQLAQHLDIPHVEMDGLFWKPKWTPTPDDEFRKRVAEAIIGDAWVVDGNYSRVRDIIWDRVEMVVWLDYPFRVILWRLLWRMWWRAVKQEALWNGNRERMRMWFSRDSLLVWAITSHGRRRQTYTTLFAEPEYAHILRVQLRSPHDTDDWLRTFTGSHGH